MKLICHLVHPAHYHLFKNTVKILRRKKWDILYTIRNKDVLKKLLDNDRETYINIGIEHGSSIKKIFYRFNRLNKVFLDFNPDIIISSAVEAAVIAKLHKVRSCLFFEDDLKEVKLWAFTAAPFASELVCPDSCHAWFWNKKAIKYAGYHELAYLHSNYHKNKINNDNSDSKKFLIRLAKLTAYHDRNNPGIDDELLRKVIAKLEQRGEVFISDERELPKELEKYKVKINPSEMIDFMQTLDLYIGDSQTMAAETAVLGIPSIRFNNFVGKLGYLEELEHKYELTYGIHQDYPELLFKKIDEILSIKNIKEMWKERKEKMLSEKIDVTEFIINLIETKN